MGFFHTVYRSLLYHIGNWLAFKEGKVVDYRVEEVERLRDENKRLKERWSTPANSQVGRLEAEVERLTKERDWHDNARVEALREVERLRHDLQVQKGTTATFLEDFRHAQDEVKHADRRTKHQVEENLRLRAALNFVLDRGPSAEVERVVTLTLKGGEE